MDTINKSISKKIDFLRTLMIVFVLFIHNTNTISGVKEQLPVFWAIQQINLFLFSPAVPLLYFISAYLLFMKKRNYWEIIKKRIRQILVPFLLWPTIILILYLSFNYKNIRSYDFIDYLDAYLGIFNRKGMLLPHFWFLRDLFILTLLYPIFSKNKVLDFIVFGLAIIWWLSGKSFIIGYNSLFYYMLGYFAAKYNFSWYVNKTKKTVFFLIISLLLSITGIIFTYLWKDMILIQNIIILSLCTLYIIIANYSNGMVTEKIKKYSFWIYCIHLPILMTFFIKLENKIFISVANSIVRGVVIISCYYMIPIVTIALAILSADLLQRFVPIMYGLLNGNRRNIHYTKQWLWGGGVVCLCYLLFSCVIDVENELNNDLYFSSNENAKLFQISPNGSSVKLDASNYIGDTYQWFESDSLSSEIKVINETSPILETGRLLPGIRYFKCEITNELITNSVVFCVAYTGLPALFINTLNEEEPTAEYATWPEYPYTPCTLKNAKTVYANAMLYKPDGKNIYNSGNSGCTIRLRGNTSAVVPPKKPYKLELESKEDLLAELIGRKNKKSKDRDWILLKDGTSLNTVVGLRIAEIMGVAWTPKYAFIDLIINGEYRGIYLLIESVKKSDGRICIADSGFIIERDPYYWNDKIYFVTDNFNEEYTFKYPKAPQSELTIIKEYINSVELGIKNTCYENLIDTDSFVSWLLSHDLLGTWDAGGSNIFLYREDNTVYSKLKMATPWDFDTVMDTSASVMPNMQEKWSNIHLDESRLFYKLLNSENETFKLAYKNKYFEINENVRSLLFDVLLQIIYKQGEAINISREFDSIRWNTTWNTVYDNLSEIDSWFRLRKFFLDEEIKNL